MAAKQIEVMKWLGEVLGDSEVPHFERSETNIIKLHHLMVAYKEAFEDLDEVTGYLDSRSDAYENHYKQLESNLKEFNFTSNILDTEEQKCLDALGSLYYTLNLQSASPSNFMLAINSLEEENREIDESLKKEKRLTESLLRLSKNIAHNLDELKKVSEDAERMAHNQEEELDKEAKRCDFNKEKIKKYEIDLKVLETKLERVGFEEEISLGSISNKIKKLSELEKELKNTTTTVESYTLPPDMALAEIKVEEMRQKLAEIMGHVAHTYANQN